ncbi:SDR family oxidoreductase [Rhodospirillaceae bacterium KN72]|uniref:SDR family oxidoreductase n=1 Tax=Pacificispira spongiicola TaxID=2729598 RepID=A0A7Y0HI84_9PROT|nr:SDR family oxidoreductase [Pacificispira spongiicola]NMM46717.1 SDR family oxidoreductase [Pacificispira spongiicola]
MIRHHESAEHSPDRVVILGANGFIGRALVERLHADGICTIGFGSADIDLTEPGSVNRLADILSPTDSVVVLSALTPDRGRDIDSFMKNLAIGRNVFKALHIQPVRHVVYMSSDAVYPFDEAPVDEASPISSEDYYGMMHIVREMMFRKLTGCVVAVLRCSSVYGGADSHDSYGPNRFRRQAAETGRIVLGGSGEETRDHIYVGDVVDLTVRVLACHSEGTLNLATGTSTTFMEVAETVADQFDTRPEIVSTTRTLPITHRTFDVAALSTAFPDFGHTPLSAGLKQAHFEEFGEREFLKPISSSGT